MLRKIRAHHLLCIPRFVGKGYSNDFGRNMSLIHNWLYEHPEERLKVVCEPDGICSNCPNLQEDHCVNGNDHVTEKDREIVRWLEITAEQEQTWKNLLNIVEEKITKELFENTCSSCQWYQTGICTFENRKIFPK